MKIVNFSKKNDTDDTFNIIFEFLKNIKLNEDGKLIDFNSLDIESFILEKNFNELNETLYNFIFEIFRKNSKAFFINEENSINYSLTRIFFDFVQNSGNKPCLVIFNAGIPEVYNNIGVTLLRMKRVAQSEAYFKKAVEIKPEYNEARKNLKDVREFLKNQK